MHILQGKIFGRVTKFVIKYSNYITAQINVFAKLFSKEAWEPPKQLN